MKTVFFFPGAGGREKLVHLRLLAQCSPGCKFKIIQTGNWREWVLNDLAFDDLAARACLQIYAAGATPPLLLAGSSQGGLLAYAAALSLGPAVGFLGLLDTTANGARQPLQLGSVLTRTARYLVYGDHRKGQTRKRIFWTLWNQCPGQRRTLLALITRFERLLFRNSGGVVLDWEIQMMLFDELWNTWSTFPRRLQAPAFLFRSTDSGTQDRGWQSLCANLTIVPVAGGHLTMFGEQYASNLATQFTHAVLNEI